MSRNRVWLGLLLGFCLSSTSASIAIAASSTQDPGVARAIDLLDSWSGDGAVLEQARHELDAVLASDPESAPAYREYARYFIATGGDAAFQLAEKAIDRSIELAPGFAEAFVLRGHLYTEMGRLGEADTALAQAEKLGTDDAWLQLNWGQLRLEQGRYEEASSRCGRVVATKPAKRKIRLAADECMIDYYKATGQRARVDEVYQRQLAFAPEVAWVHGNYAAYLLCTKDDYAAAEAQSRAALDRMEYGAARLILAATLYRKWAAGLDRKAPDVAQRAFDEAWSMTQTPPVQVIDRACTTSPAELAVLRAAYASGRQVTQTPADAIRRAAEDAPRGVIGMWELQVVASGRDARNIYLNSEADYRDPRNLTIRFDKSATAAFTKKFGQAPDVALKGKRIAIAGYAQQQRIDFLAGGNPTGKFYYQTHVAVIDPGQVFLVDEKAAGVLAAR